MQVRRNHNHRNANNKFDWLLPGNGGDESSPAPTPSLPESCRLAGISRIFFLRHGQTAPKPDDGRDFDRVLTDTGLRQAREAGSAFAAYQELLPLYRKALVSPAPRTVETCRLFLEAAMEASTGSSNDVSKFVGATEIVPIQSLYDGTMQPEGSRLFRKIGYAPLRAYVDNDDDPEDRETARRVLGEYGRTVLSAVSETLRRDWGERSSHEEGSVEEDRNASPTTSTLLVVGHAIYLPAAALAVALTAAANSRDSETSQHEDDFDVILSTNTREAEGYLIDLRRGRVQYLARPSSS